MYNLEHRAGDFFQKVNLYIYLLRGREVWFPRRLADFAGSLQLDKVAA